jgi:CBS-domain-containing membrane protein
MKLMADTGLRRLPVVRLDGKLVGLLSLDDIACEAGRALRGGVNYELRTRVGHVSTAPQVFSHITRAPLFSESCG